MPAISKPKIYRDMIDQLVEMCRHGQGQIGVRRAREGIWNANARADSLEDQHAANVLLSRLTPDERDVIARLLAAEVVTGVFETLKVLEDFDVKPFDEGYEGSPSHDFIGRLDSWEWPEVSNRDDR